MTAQSSTDFLIAVQQIQIPVILENLLMTFLWGTFIYYPHVYRKVLQSPKGKSKILKDGYGYNFSSHANTTFYFKCDKRHGCKAGCNFSSRSSTFQFQGSHDHAPDPLKPLVLKAKKALAAHSLDKPMLDQTKLSMKWSPHCHKVFFTEETLIIRISKLPYCKDVIQPWNCKLN